MKKLLYILPLLFLVQYSIGQVIVVPQKITVLNSGSKVDSSVYSTKANVNHVADSVLSLVPAQFNPIAGTGTTLSGTYPNITFNSTGGSGTVTYIKQGFGTKIDSSSGNKYTVTVDTAALVQKVNLHHPLYFNPADTSLNVDTTGFSGSGVVKWFSILNYGASTGASSATNTTAINAAFAAAKLDSGTVYIPAGTYFVDSLIWNPVVSIIGDGSGSILKSNSATSLLTYNGTLVGAKSAKLSNFTLEGNSIGTTGINANAMVNFNISNITIQHFNTGVNLVGCLIGSFNNCVIQQNVNGVIGTKGGGNMANLVTFNGGTIGGNSNIGLQWSYGAGLMLNQVDLESNGTSGNNATGAISLVNMAQSSEPITMALTRCWFEGNFGKTINIGIPAGNATYVIQSCLIFAEANPYGLYVDGSGGSGNQNKVYINNTGISQHSTFDVYATGAYASVTSNFSNIVTSSFVSSATSIVNNETATTLYGNINSPMIASITNLSTGTAATASFKLSNSASSVSFYKVSTTYGGYRNIAAGDVAIYNSAKNISFLNDDASGNINFAVANNTPAFTILTNYVNANNMTFGAATRNSILSLPGGGAAAGTSPMNFANGVLATTPQQGNFEYANKLYFTYAGGRSPLLDSTTASSTYESSLGNPSTNGYVLSSTTGGVRSWIAPSGGGGSYTANAPLLISGSVISADTSKSAGKLATYSDVNNKFTLPSYTSGSVLFADGTTIVQNAANLFWDNTNKRLNIGSPSVLPYDVNIYNNINGKVGLGILNLASAANAYAGIYLATSAGAYNGQLFKASSGTTAYKSISPYDLGFYNTGSGNITIFNDYTSGNVNITAGGSSAAQLVINTNGTLNLSSLKTGSTAPTTTGTTRTVITDANGLLSSVGSTTGQTTLVAGTKAISIAGVTTGSTVQVTFVSVGGTVTTTWQYSAVCTSGTVTITALTNTGATDTSDTSTLNYSVTY